MYTISHCPSTIPTSDSYTTLIAHTIQWNYMLCMLSQAPGGEWEECIESEEPIRVRDLRLGAGLATRETE